MPGLSSRSASSAYDARLQATAPLRTSQTSLAFATVNNFALPSVAYTSCQWIRDPSE